MAEFPKESAQFLTTSDAAVLLGVTAATVRAYEANGRLRAVRTQGGWRLFMRDDVERLRSERAAWRERRV
jgi:excisionase family DNA binding protein